MYILENSNQKTLQGEEDLQIAEKRREVKGKGEKERWIHFNADFQRRARRDKKAFLSNQCKEREENNRMGKTRDLFKKIRQSLDWLLRSLLSSRSQTLNF